jgi:hypothetical protein
MIRLIILLINQVFVEKVVAAQVLKTFLLLWKVRCLVHSGPPLSPVLS